MRFATKNFAHWKLVLIAHKNISIRKEITTYTLNAYQYFPKWVLHCLAVDIRLIGLHFL